jgi:hypothetical protein
MDEKQLAAELQDTKDDADEWGDAAPATSAGNASTKRRLAAMVSVRLSPAELEQIQKHAESRGESVSSYLRGLAIRDTSPVEKPFSTTPFVTSSTDARLTRSTTRNPMYDDGDLMTRAL